ncbi:MAG: hypothetical protein ACFE95_21275 [Candidatus Hodarchaeota archaeon]
MKFFPTNIARIFPFFNRKNRIECLENWKQQLLSLYIVRNTDGICLFSHHFRLGMVSQIENQLVGMGFIAMIKMMKEIVDSTVKLNLIDLGKKIVLIDERKNYFTILVTTKNTIFLREKLRKFTDYFEKIFELQFQINNNKCVCLEDYALTSDLVSMVFDDQSGRSLEIIPIIFKSIRKKYSIKPRHDKKISKISGSNNYFSSNHENSQQKEKKPFEFFRLRSKY